MQPAHRFPTVRRSCHGLCHSWFLRWAPGGSTESFQFLGWAPGGSTGSRLVPLMGLWLLRFVMSWTGGGFGQGWGLLTSHRDPHSCCPWNPVNKGWGLCGASAMLAWGCSQFCALPSRGCPQDSCSPPGGTPRRVSLGPGPPEREVAPGLRPSRWPYGHPRCLLDTPADLCPGSPHLHAATPSSQATGLLPGPLVGGIGCDLVSLLLS